MAHVLPSICLSGRSHPPAENPNKVPRPPALNFLIDSIRPYLACASPGIRQCVCQGRCQLSQRLQGLLTCSFDQRCSIVSNVQGRPMGPKNRKYQQNTPLACCFGFYSKYQACPTLSPCACTSILICVLAHMCTIQEVFLRALQHIH